MVYNSLIMNHTFESRFNKLVILQKKVIRIIGKAEYLAHTDPVLKQFGLPKIDDIGQQQVTYLSTNS